MDKEIAEMQTVIEEIMAKLNMWISVLLLFYLFIFSYNGNNFVPLNQRSKSEEFRNVKLRKQNKLIKIIVKVKGII